MVDDEKKDDKPIPKKEIRQKEVEKQIDREKAGDKLRELGESDFERQTSEDFKKRWKGHGPDGKPFGRN